jgi:hypothetical protein
MDQSYRSVKIEKSRRVVESRPVCMDLSIFRFSQTDNFDPSLNFPHI